MEKKIINFKIYVEYLNVFSFYLKLFKVLYFESILWLLGDYSELIDGVCDKLNFKS